METLTDGYTLEQEARVVRANREEMTFTKTPNGWMVTTTRGSYRVGDGYCGCADWKHRGSYNGTRCKHQVGLGMHLLASQGRADFAPAPDPQPDPDAVRVRRERDQALAWWLNEA